MPDAEATPAPADGVILVAFPSGRSATVDGQDVLDVVARARDAVSVKRVFGEPYERGRVTVIPAARIWGGGGGGAQPAQGSDTPESGSGFGGGFGLMGRPAGVFVITDDKVRWQPAVDPTMIMAAFLVVAVGVLRSVRRRRRRARWAQRQAMAVRAAEPERAPDEDALGGGGQQAR